MTPDSALSLPTFSHFLIVNKLLSLSLSLSLSLALIPLLPLSLLPLALCRWIFYKRDIDCGERLDISGTGFKDLQDWMVPVKDMLLFEDFVVVVILRSYQRCRWSTRILAVLAVLAVRKHLKVLRRSLPHGTKLGNSQKVHDIEFRNVE